MFWKRATNQGAIASIFFGGVVWMAFLLPMMGWLPAPDAWVELANQVPPQFFGLVASVVAMVVGSLLPQWIPHDPQGQAAHA